MIRHKFLIISYNVNECRLPKNKLTNKQRNKQINKQKMKGQVIIYKFSNDKLQTLYHRLHEHKQISNKHTTTT